jgi:hypothetical protein
MFDARTSDTGAAAPTPEVAAYKAQKEVAERGVHQIWRRVAIFFGFVLVAVLSFGIYFGTTINQIKTTVDNHTTTLTKQAECQNQSFDAILKDARLAFTGNKNPADYAKAPKSC